MNQSIEIGLLMFFFSNYLFFNSKFWQNARLCRALGTEDLSTGSAMMLSCDNSKCGPASMTNFSISPVWGNIGLKHGFGLPNRRKLPAFSFHQVEGVLETTKHSL